MNTCTLVADVENYGYQLTQADGKIKYRGQGGLPDNLISKNVVIYLNSYQQ